MSVTLVLGGARSGKSRFAEREADQWLDQYKDGKRIYVATARIFDEEMRDRVELHKHQRGENWQTIEEPYELTNALSHHIASGEFVLVDCLTLWLTNLLLAEKDTDLAVKELCEALSRVESEVVLVANEVGLGIVPENKLARQFRDIAGIANQKVAEVADKVVFITAGLPMILKGA